MAALRLLLLPGAVAALASAADTQAHAGAAAEPSLLMLLQQRSEAVADGGHDHGLGGDHDQGGQDHGHREVAAQHASLGTGARQAGSRKQAGHAALMMVGLVVLVFSLSTCQCLWATPKEVASKAPSPRASGDFVRRPLRSPTAAIPGRSASAASMPKVSSHEQIARSSSQPTVTGGPPRRKSDSA